MRVPKHGNLLRFREFFNWRFPHNYNVAICVQGCIRDTCEMVWGSASPDVWESSSRKCHKPVLSTPLEVVARPGWGLWPQRLHAISRLGLRHRLAVMAGARRVMAAPTARACRSRFLPPPCQKTRLGFSRRQSNVFSYWHHNGGGTHPPISNRATSQWVAGYSGPPSPSIRPE